MDWGVKILSVAIVTSIYLIYSKYSEKWEKIPTSKHTRSNNNLCFRSRHVQVPQEVLQSRLQQVEVGPEGDQAGPPAGLRASHQVKISGWKVSLKVLYILPQNYIDSSNLQSAYKKHVYTLLVPMNGKQHNNYNNKNVWMYGVWCQYDISVLVKVCRCNNCRDGSHQSA